MSPALVTALLLAVAQGATEFLPVSSSGHLVLLGIALGSYYPAGGGESFFVIGFLHLATGAAVVVYYRRLYRQAARGLWRRGTARRFLARYAVAQGVTGAAALPLYLILSSVAVGDGGRASLGVLGAALLANAGALLLAPRGGDSRSGGSEDEEERLPEVSWGGAALVGLAQGLAIVPGLSRSGLTIAAGLRASLSREDAASFSFLLAAPVMLGAALFWGIRDGQAALAMFAGRGVRGGYDGNGGGGICDGAGDGAVGNGLGGSRAAVVVCAVERRFGHRGSGCGGDGRRWRILGGTAAVFLAAMNCLTGWPGCVIIASSDLPR